jgi:DNA modification methylase
VPVDLVHGDCREALRVIRTGSIDAIITDPPYEIGLANREWDQSGIAYDVAVWRECLRILKPGGYLLAFGATRTYHRLACAIEDAGFTIRDSLHWVTGQGFPKGENLKPSHEPIVLARKGDGAGFLNIDACRTDVGRHPANFLMDEETAAEMDKQSGLRPTSKTTSGARSASMFRPGKMNPQGPVYGDEGGASRFFPVFRYVRKANRRERGEYNDHLTVKPIELMEWLVNLVSKPGDRIVDPFMGSGSTGLAAVGLGRKFVGIDRDRNNVEIARRRFDERTFEVLGEDLSGADRV